MDSIAVLFYGKMEDCLAGNHTHNPVGGRCGIGLYVATRSNRLACEATVEKDKKQGRHFVKFRL